MNARPSGVDVVRFLNRTLVNDPRLPENLRNEVGFRMSRLLLGSVYPLQTLETLLTGQAEVVESSTDNAETIDHSAGVSFFGFTIEAGDLSGWLVFADWFEDHREYAKGKPEHVSPDTVGFLRLPAFQEFWHSLPQAYATQVASFQHLQEQCPDLPLSSPPSLEAVLKRFSLIEWLALKHLKEPTLVLIPPLDFDACVSLLSRHDHTSNDPNLQTYVNPLYTTYPHPTPKKWQALFVSGEQHPEPLLGDDLRKPLRERIQAEVQRLDAYNAALHTLEPAASRGQAFLKPLDRFSYAWLMWGGLERHAEAEEQYDTRGWTVLHGDTIWEGSKKSRVPVAGFGSGGRQVFFDSDDAGSRGVNARFRCLVGGDVET